MAPIKNDVMTYKNIRFPENFQTTFLSGNYERLRLTYENKRAIHVQSVISARFSTNLQMCGQILL
jgi:hypothetical protein